MRKTFLALAALLFLLSAVSSAATFPTYENTVRQWGTVTQIYKTKNQVVAFVLTRPDGGQARFDCGDFWHELACDAFSVGDSILVSGHLEDKLACEWDGIDNFPVPNVIYRCDPSGCVQLTP